MTAFVVVNNRTRSRIATYATREEADGLAALMDHRAGSSMWFRVEAVPLSGQIADPLRLAKSYVRLAVRAAETGGPALNAIFNAHCLNDRYSLGLDILGELMRVRSLMPC